MSYLRYLNARISKGISFSSCAITIIGRPIGIDHSCFYCCCCWFCIVLVYDGKNDPWNIFKDVPVIFEIHPKELREGEYKLTVREFQEYVLWEVFREQQKPFLVTGWAEVPALAWEGTEIFMAAVSIGTLNPCDTFRVVSTFNEPFDCLLDVDDPVFTVPLWVFVIIAFFESAEIVL